jgi:uncharacterized protein YodC (DUF2158 family)
VPFRTLSQRTSRDNRAVTETTDIRPGQTVVLKGGGPAMTVQARSQNLAYCSWLEGGAVRHGTFAVDSLQPDPAAPTPGLQRPGADCR